MKKILFIEDDKLLVRACSALLKKLGYETLFLENGEGAVQLSMKEKPDLIVLDIVMPVKDGFQVLKELGANNDTKGIPVIVLTVLSEEKDIAEIMRLGAKKVVVKTNYTFKGLVDEITKMNPLG